MTAVLLRRRRLGNGSCTGIRATMQQAVAIVRHWRDQWPADVTHVFRWGCTANIPDGPMVVNNAAGIHWCSDKRGSRLAMQEAGVSVPETWATDVLIARFNAGEDMPEGRLVQRPAMHAQGRMLRVGTAHDLLDHDQQPVYLTGYISRLINKVAEYRVFVCQGRVVWVARKTPGNPDQVAWNVAQGGRFDNVPWGDWPLRVVKEAVKAHNVSGCDFTGIDVMVDAEGTPYVLEANSAPSQTSPYRQSCVAKAFDWIVQNGKAPIPVAERRGDWKKWGHPCLSEEIWR